jgi:hypothetical protein
MPVNNYSSDAGLIGQKRLSCKKNGEALLMIK